MNEPNFDKAKEPGFDPAAFLFVLLGEHKYLLKAS